MVLICLSLQVFDETFQLYESLSGEFDREPYLASTISTQRENIPVRLMPLKILRVQYCTILYSTLFYVLYFMYFCF